MKHNKIEDDMYKRRSYALFLVGAACWLAACSTTPDEKVIVEDRNNSNQDMSGMDAKMDMTKMPDIGDNPCGSDRYLCEVAGYECGELKDVTDLCKKKRDVKDCAFSEDTTDGCGEGKACGVEKPGVCGCVPKTCKSEGVLCGQMDNGCGEMVTCDLFCVDNLAAGTNHTCAIGSGRVRCWGKNSDGQLGTGGTRPAKNPAKVPPLHPDEGGGDAYLLSAGGRHTCAVLRNGKAICWGDNEHGQLGNGTNVSTSTVNVGDSQFFVGANNIRQVVSGDRHTCALLDLDPDDAFSNGFETHCWGSNEYGIQGRGPAEADGGLMINAIQTGPKKVFGLSSNIVQLAAGDLHTCALDNGGDVYCWGNNAFNQLGTREPVTRKAHEDGMEYTFFDNWSDPQADPSSFRPAQVPHLSDVAQIAAGKTFTCAIKTDETVWCWGAMRFNHARDTCKVFDKDAERCSEWPERTEPDVYPIVIHNRSNGMPRYTNTGEPAVSSVLASSATHKPTQMKYALTGMPILAKKIGAGFEHMCFVTDEMNTGKFNLSCIGDNGNGQLGLNDNSSRAAPNAEELLTLDNNNNIVHALLPTPPEGNDPMAEEIQYRNLLVTPLALGNFHTCVHNTDNNMKCWGDNRDGQIGNEDLMRDNSYRPFIVKLEAEVD